MASSSSSHVKILFIGPCAGGKSFLVNTLAENQSSTSLPPTVGVRYGLRINMSSGTVGSANSLKGVGTRCKFWEKRKRAMCWGGGRGCGGWTMQRAMGDGGNEL